MNPMKPEPALLAKLGSIAIHSEEMLSDKGHGFDRTALESLLKDYDVSIWLAEMDKLSYVTQEKVRTLKKIPNIFGFELYRADNIHGKRPITEKCESASISRR